MSASPPTSSQNHAAEIYTEQGWWALLPITGVESFLLPLDKAILAGAHDGKITLIVFYSGIKFQRGDYELISMMPGLK